MLNVGFRLGSLKFIYIFINIKFSELTVFLKMSKNNKYLNVIYFISNLIIL